MNRATPIIACALCIAALGFAICATAADPPALPDLGGTRSSGTQHDALASDAVCTKCHDENDNKPIFSIYQTRHGVKADARTPSCQSCHGGSEQHVKNAQGTSPRPPPEVVFGTKIKIKTASTPDMQNQACMGCHQAGLRVNWSGSEHQSHDLACSSCHQVHASADAVLDKLTQPEVCESCHKTQRAQLLRISTHPVRAGEMGCSDCHNPHGSTGPKLLVKDSVNETCYTCHAEKRGPFLWEHGPVVDDCTNCHTPHGSTNASLLKQRVPFLCQDCHTGDHGSGINSGANLVDGNVTTVNGALPRASQSPRTQTNARACLNCHVLVHGSNHPAGGKFQR
jgi:DmsE family decaheme c-type cytochrome